MKIYVCVKHVPDSAANIIVSQGNRFDESVKYVINPYDEIAVEEAVRVKEQNGNSEVIAVTLGREGAINTIRTALSMGADRGILITTDARPDSIITARALKAAIEQDGRPDIIFTGKESIDSEGMQTMYRLANALGMPAANNIVAFSVTGGQVTVECEQEAGARQVVEMDIPCMVGAGKGLNNPRYVRIPDVMKARRKHVEEIDLESLDFKKPSSSLEIMELQPALEKRQCRIFKGKPEDVVQELVKLIREEGKVF